MAESLVYSFDLPVYPERVYRAWLNASELCKITGAPAQVAGRVGGAFSLLAGGVTGSFEVLTPTNRIVMTWNMADFPGPGGQVELLFEPTCTGTEVKLYQRGIPSGKTPALLQWWEQNLSRPLHAYFNAIVGEYIADMGDG